MFLSLRRAQKLHASLLKSGILRVRGHGGSSSHDHCHLLRSSVRCGSSSHADVIISFNSLLSVYVKADLIDDAFHLFDAMPQADAVSWNTLISGLARALRFLEAVFQFFRMTHSDVKPDNFTYSAVVPCCGDLTVGCQVHARIVKAASHSSDPIIATNLIKMYAEYGEMSCARRIFDEMSERDLVSWNVMLDCCSNFGANELCLNMFLRMVGDGIRADEFTIATILNELAGRSCVCCGMQMHALILKRGFLFDHFTCNALLNLYSKGNFFYSAMKLFGEMLKPDVISWTALITGLAANRCEWEAFDIFNRMQKAGVPPNSFTFGSLIGSCISCNVFELGRQYHCLALKHGLEIHVVVGSVIMSMYSSYGMMADALKIFGRLPERDIVSWNAIICGLAQNGEPTKALGLFDEMMGSCGTSTMPDDVTFVGVLSACSHGGLIQKGCCYFTDMVTLYNIYPKAEHYACMVDLLARGGLLEEAEAMVLALPSEPDDIILSSLLAGCRRHENSTMAKRIIRRLQSNKLMNSSSYVLLSNLCTVNKDWDGALEVRNMMPTNGVHKVAGNSWVEIRGQIHCFTSGYMHHAQIELLWEMLGIIHLTIFDGGEL